MSSRNIREKAAFQETLCHFFTIGFQDIDGLDIWSDQMGQIEAERGYLVVAVYRRDFLEMAVDQALSLREFTRFPIALIADEQLVAIAKRKYARVFDHIRVLPERFRFGRAHKLGVGEATPYQRALVIDADSIIVAPVDPVWDKHLDKDFVVLGEILTRNDDRMHHGFSTRKLMDKFSLERYQKTNGGVLYFERDEGRKIFSMLLTCYKEEIQKKLHWGFLGDELPVAVVGGRVGFSMFPSPGPMHWREELWAFDPCDIKKPICHLIGPLNPDAWRWLIDGIRRRRRAAGLPQGSLRYWRKKNSRATRNAQNDLKTGEGRQPLPRRRFFFFSR